MDQTNAQQPQGKGMAIAGFVLALVAFVFYWIIAGVVAVQAALGGGYGLGIFWLILSLAATGLSVMGMMKLGKTGGKKGLAITGMIIGLVALVLTALLVMGIGKIQDEASKAGSDFSNKMEEALKKIDSASGE
jgi:predicted anti-sigma-YlaC factor YlaD